MIILFIEKIQIHENLHPLVELKVEDQGPNLSNFKELYPRML